MMCSKGGATNEIRGKTYLEKGATDSDLN